MAMRGRGSGAAGPGRGRVVGAVRPVFEDFKPVSEWQQDDESHILSIYLPGFMKEQLRVSTEGRNIIRVRGERLIAGNKWGRFLEDFQVPENGEMNSIRAKFQGGVLNITVPKKTINHPLEALPPKISPHVDATQRQASPQKGHDIVPPQVGTSQTTEKKHLEPERDLGDTGIRQVSNEIQRDRKSMTPLRNTEMAVPVPPAERDESSKLNEKHAESEQADSLMKKMVEEERAKHEKSKSIPEDDTDKKIKLGKNAPASTHQETENHIEPKGTQISHPTGADYGTYAMEKYKNAMKGLTELNEERKLLVNMGVGVLVIMALSAYVTYKFAAGKDNK